MDYRLLSQIPDSFYAETKKLYEQNQMGLFSQPHAFISGGNEYSVVASRRDLEILVNQLEHAPKTTLDDSTNDLGVFFESSKLIDEICRKYPNSNPNMKWNDDYKRVPGYMIPWEHIDSPVNAISVGIRERSILTKPLSPDEYHKAHFIILEMIRRMMTDSDTQTKLIRYLTNPKGLLQSNTIYTSPFVDTRLELHQLYLTVKKNNVLWLSWKLKNKILDYPNYQDTAKDLANGTDLFGCHQAHGKAKSYDAEVEPDELILKQRQDEERAEFMRRARELYRQYQELLENDIIPFMGSMESISGDVIGCDWYEAHVPRVAEAAKTNGFRLATIRHKEEADNFIASCSGFVIGDNEKFVQHLIEANPSNAIYLLHESMIRREALAKYLKAGKRIPIFSEADFAAYAEKGSHQEEAFYRKIKRIKKKQLEAAMDMAGEDYSLSSEAQTGIFTNPEGTEYRTTLLNCTCPAYQSDRERNGVCKHMIALAIILGWRPDKPEAGIPAMDAIPAGGMGILKSIVKGQKEQFDAYTLRAASSSGQGKNEPLIGDQYRQQIDRDDVVTVPSKHFTLAGAGKRYIWTKKWIEEKGGVVHDTVVQKGHYLVVCLETEPNHIEEYQNEISEMIGQVLANRIKKAKTKIVTDHQLFKAK